VTSADPGAASGPSEDAHGLVVSGPTLSLRYARADDAPALFDLASDPAVTRFFSWGPYTSLEQPQAYIGSLRPSASAVSCSIS
jgi:RimJ/RimL family protein N-acetyltransferase